MRFLEIPMWLGQLQLLETITLAASQSEQSVDQNTILTAANHELSPSTVQAVH